MALNGFGVYLTDYTNNQTYELPVNPAEVKLKYEEDDKSQTVINLGEVNQLGNLKLVSISIESTLPTKPTHYMSVDKDKLESPQTYIDFLKNIQKEKHHVQLVISSTKISMTMTVSSFEYGFKSGYVDEYVYTLELKEYREYKYRKVSTATKAAPKKNTRPAPPKKIGVGSIVIVNGVLHADSSGRGAGIYEKNARRKITYMAPGKPYSIHVSLVNGGARGWVRQSEVRLA